MVFRQDVYASVQEFEPITRIAWGGGALESEAYHAWIIRPTPNGTHVWTEETMQGPLWIELAKQAHLLAHASEASGKPREVATQRGRSSTR